MINKITNMGFLRNLLQGTALIAALLMPMANLPGYTNDWNLFFGGVLPAVAPLLIIVLMLDVMMSKVWKDGASDERTAELNFIIRAHCVVALILGVSFLTIFLPVLVPS